MPFVNDIFGQISAKAWNSAAKSNYWDTKTKIGCVACDLGEKMTPICFGVNKTAIFDHLLILQNNRT